MDTDSSAVAGPEHEGVSQRPDAFPLVFVAIFPAIALFGYASFVVGRHADAYASAGASAAEALGGAVAGQVLVAGGALVTSLLFWRVRIFARWANRRRVLIAAGSTIGLAAFFAALPTLVAGWSVLTIFLSMLITLLFDVVLVAVVTLITWGAPKFSW